MDIAAALIAVEEHAELLRGPKGERGVSGRNGAPGKNGARGPIGEQGPAGESITGLAGQDGRDGKDGARGPAGVRGPTGPKGETGAAGKNGQDGVGPDEKVRISRDDPKAGFLADKLTAGTGIEIRTETDKRGERLVIDARRQLSGGGGGQAGILVYDDGVGVGFGDSVSFDGGDPVTISGGLIRVPVGSGGSALTVSDEGSSLTAAAASIDFVGAGVTATAVGTAVTVTVPGGLAVLAPAGVEWQPETATAVDDRIDFGSKAFIALTPGTTGADIPDFNSVDPLDQIADEDVGWQFIGFLDELPFDAIELSVPALAADLPAPPLAGVLDSGNDADGIKITGLGDPADPQDAATKAYVDTFIPQGGTLTANLAAGGFGLTGTDGAVISVTTAVAANAGSGADSTGGGFEFAPGGGDNGGEAVIHGGNGSVGDGARVETRGGTATDAGRVAITTDNDTGSSGDLLTAQGDGTALWVAPSGLPGSPETYTESNVVTDRSFDASASTLDEVLHVLGSLISDLRARGVVA